MAGQTVLIVDDDPGTVTVVSTILQREGYTLVTAYSGAEALARYDDTPPDLILLDLAMPGMSGFDVARAIRQREAGQRRTPILFLTAHAQGYFVSRDLQVDADGYIIKPVAPQRLRSEVARLLSS